MEREAEAPFMTRAARRTSLGIHEAEELDDEDDAIEVADFGLERGEALDGGEAGGFVPGIKIEVLAEAAGNVGAVGAARAVAGDEDEVAGGDGAHEAEVGGDIPGGREFDAEFLEAIFDVHSCGFLSPVTGTG
jgi:hypothetical protein